MLHHRLSLLTAFILALVLPATARQAKIIQVGWGMPEPAYIRQHVAEMEQRPFDGVVMGIKGIREGEEVNTYTILGTERWQPDWFAQAIADLKATPFHQFTDNFVLVGVTPCQISWFDDSHWDVVLHNAAILGSLARRGGLVGVVFDPEPYGKENLWDYRKQPQDHSFADYRDQVRRRGAQFMAALASDFPALRLLCFFGASVVDHALASPDPEAALARENYGLLPFFMEGMATTLPPAAQLTDGCEGGYYMERREPFLEAYHDIKGKALAVIAPENRAAYARVQVGFGIYPDRNWGQPEWKWQVDKPEKNYYTPAEVKANLANAATVADSYVWVYTEALNWWTGKGEPPGYAEAIRQVWLQPQVDRLLEQVGQRQVPPANLVAYLPAQWKVKGDRDGRARGWQDPGFDDAAWQTAKADEQWFKQPGLESLSGAAWGRTWVDVPATAAGKKVFLAVGALDENGDVYVNGRLVMKRRETGNDAWRQPFLVDVTSALRPGERNLVAVRAIAGGTLGGVFRPCALVTGVAE